MKPSVLNLINEVRASLAKAKEAGATDEDVKPITDGVDCLAEQFAKEQEAEGKAEEKDEKAEKSDRFGSTATRSHHKKSEE